MSKLAPTGRSGSRVIWVLSFLVIAFVFWARNAPLDEVVRGPGTLVPASQNQIVQSLEGGILDEIVVGEGDIVAQGEVIARFNQTRFRADVEDLEGQILSREAQKLRFEAEIAATDTFTLPDDIWQRDAELAASEEQLFIARREKHLAAIQSLEEQALLQADRVSLMRNMVDQNAMPALELLNAEVVESESRAALEELGAQYQLERAEELATVVSELAQLRAQVAQSRDQLSRSTLLSPADGVVNTVYVSTVGGVVQSGEPIFEITPLNDELLVEVRILPRDIAFIAVDMPATIKLTAYDYTVFGSLSGKVVQVSADTFEDEQSPNNESYYKVLVQIDPASLEERREVFEIRPGMVSDVELYAGQKTVMQYLMTPLIKSSEALREP